MSQRILERQERTTLINIVAGLYEFTDAGARGRRVFLQESAELGRFVLGLDLSGPSRLVASDLIGRVEGFGKLPDRQAYHSLGALLAAVLELPDLGEEKAKFVAGLIVRYSLITDPDYLDELRSRFGIVELSDRKGAEEAPRHAVAPPESPVFAPEIGDQAALERIINSEDNFLDIYLLSGAIYCAHAVGRIEIPEGRRVGTGFLIGPRLLMTNHHVLKEQKYLERAIVRFGALLDPKGVESPGTVVPMETDFYHVSPSDELDYALLRLRDEPLADLAADGELAKKPMAELARAGKHRGYLTLVSEALIEDERVNIIQHPDGRPLKVVMTQNYIRFVTDSRVQYVADTMHGSSGSPVFNNRWQVVALHHSGSPYPPESAATKVKKAWKGDFRVNEGIPMRAILKDMEKRGLDRYLPRP